MRHLPIILTLSLLTLSSSFADDRPNILWITIEDWSPDLSCYGTKGIHTPHVDQLASEGIRYEAAFTTSPVCSTSRSAMMTGFHQNYIGAQQHRDTGQEATAARDQPDPAPVRRRWLFHLPDELEDGLQLPAGQKSAAVHGGRLEGAPAGPAIFCAHHIWWHSPRVEPGPSAPDRDRGCRTATVLSGYTVHPARLGERARADAAGRPRSRRPARAARRGRAGREHHRLLHRRPRALSHPREAIPLRRAGCASR